VGNHTTTLHSLILVYVLEGILISCKFAYHYTVVNMESPYGQQLNAKSLTGQHTMYHG